MNVYVLFILLIILILVGILLLMSMSGKPIPWFENSYENTTISGGVIEEVQNQKIENLEEINKQDKSRKIYIVDGLNYIYDKYLTTNKQPSPDLNEEHLISNYPNIIYIWKAISSLRHEHKKDKIVFVIKNQDGYKLSTYDDRLYKKWAKTYKMGIVLCYDPTPIKGEHYLKGRDDRTVCEIFEKYKSEGYNVELISKDTYKDKSMFSNIPSFKKIKYGDMPDI